MARKKPEESPPPGAPLWMATYGDMVTLCLCFFVLLFAMSTVDAQKLQEVSRAMSSHFAISMGGAPSTAISINTMTGNGMLQLPNEGSGVRETLTDEQIDSQQELAKMASEFKTYFADQNVADKVEVNSNEKADYIEIRFDNSVLFDIGKAELKPEALNVLDMLTSELEKYPDNDIKIEGHTDNIPIRTAQFPSNWELSASRAISVAKYYVEVKGFSPNRVSTEGFGEYRPEFPNDTPENRAKNRRVVMKILGVFSSNKE